MDKGEGFIKYKVGVQICLNLISKHKIIKTVDHKSKPSVLNPKWLNIGLFKKNRYLKYLAIRCDIRRFIVY